MHDSLAITVANAVLSDPTDSTVRIFCKSLSQMELTASNKVIFYVRYIRMIFAPQSTYKSI